MGFLDGALRIMPGWQVEVAGHPLILAVLVPALIVPGAFFTVLAAYPLIERRLPLTTPDPGTHLGSGARPESGPAGDSPAALAQALITLHAELDRIYHEAARQLRLTPEQAQLLCRCEHNPPRMGDLSRMLNCDNSNITGLVDRVARQGLVIRSTHQRRVIRVALTPRGDKLMQRFRAELQAPRRSGAGLEVRLSRALGLCPWLRLRAGVEAPNTAGAARGHC